MLHYSVYTKPSSSAWVVFIHGAGGCSNIWYKQIRDFQKDFNVLLIDLRGHGKSKQPFRKKLKKDTFTERSNDVLEVLDHLNIKSGHFVGISLGTIIIREIAERNPTRVETMILGGAIVKLNLRGQILMKLGVLLKSVIPYLDIGVNPSVDNLITEFLDRSTKYFLLPKYAKLSGLSDIPYSPV